MHQHKEMGGERIPQSEQPERAETTVSLGLKTSRVEALSDGVFSIAMTLLVLNLAPELGLGSKASLPEGVNPVLILFQDQWIKLLTYVMSFVVVGFYWVGHHAQFQYIQRANRTLLWINIYFLLAISFVPFSTAFLAKFEAYSPAQAFYGVHILIIGAILYFHWWYAARTPLLTGNLDRHFVRAAARRILYAPAIALVAIALSFFPVASLVCYAIIPIVYVFPGHIDLHWTRPHANHVQEHESKDQAPSSDA